MKISPKFNVPFIEKNFIFLQIYAMLEPSENLVIDVNPKNYYQF